jgi:hypothetical protein
MAISQLRFAAQQFAQPGAGAQFPGVKQGVALLILHVKALQQ